MRPARTRVKICGLTSAADAAEAVKAGADAVGVVLADSPRRLTLEQAEETLTPVGPLVTRVGVFVDAEPDFVSEAVARLGLHLAQFHGTETPEACAGCAVPAVKAFRVGEDFDPREMDAYEGCVAAVLLDTYVPRVNGGSGRTFAWEALPALPEWAPLVVAGGLTPVNVGAAVRALRPYAVDVASGVEEHVRGKDPLKMRAFVAAVRMTDEECP